jgi:hypothetical protein
LQETNKKHNKAAVIYEEAVRRIHAKGIHITASFAVGFDHDTVEEFDKIVEFTNNTGLSYINLNILGAPPGSELYDRLNREGRWYGISPDYRSGLFPCMHYQKMSQTELFEAYFEAIQKVYAWKNILHKASILFGNGDFKERYYDHQADAAFQFRASMLLLKHFAYSANKYKRRLFFRLLGKVLTHKVAIDKAASYMLSMMSYHNHIKHMLENIEEYREIVKKHDKGAWENIYKP